MADDFSLLSEEFIINEALNLQICTWNVSNTTFLGSNLNEWFFSNKCDKNPDLFVIGLQDINSNLIVNSASESVDYWISLIHESLTSADK